MSIEYFTFSPERTHLTDTEAGRLENKKTSFNDTKLNPEQLNLASNKNQTKQAGANPTKHTKNTGGKTKLTLAQSKNMTHEERARG